MNEHSYIKAVHRLLPPELFKWKLQASFVGGVPDAMYAGPSDILFVEYKYVPKLPKRDPTKIRTTRSAQQVLWLNKMDDFGKKVAVVVGGTDDTNVILTNKCWEAPLTKSEYIERAVSRKDVAAYIQKTCQSKDSI